MKCCGVGGEGLLMGAFEMALLSLLRSFRCSRLDAGGILCELVVVSWRKS